MNPTHSPLRCLIVGQSGTGKSTYQRKALLNLPARCRFLFDPDGQYAFNLKLRPARTSDELIAAVSTGWVCFDPAALYPGKYAQAFDFFTRWAFRAAERVKGTKIFGCDELQKWTGTGARDIPPGFAVMLETGRHVALDCVLVAQGANLVHNRIQNQITELVAFHTIGKRALGFLEDMELDPNEVRALVPGRYVARNLNTGSVTRGEVFRYRGK